MWMVGGGRVDSRCIGSARSCKASRLRCMTKAWPVVFERGCGTTFAKWADRGTSLVVQSPCTGAASRSLAGSMFHGNDY
jgi:hypothetical protein